MKHVRWLLVLAVLAAGSLSIHRLCYLPARCHLLASRIQDEMTRFLTSPRHDRVVEARAHLAVLQPCIQKCPPDGTLVMVVALNYRLLERSHEAIRVYENFLAYERRPEVYFNIGSAYLEAGDRPKAQEFYTIAAIYSPEYVPEITDGQLLSDTREIFFRRENVIEKGP